MSLISTFNPSIPTIYIPLSLTPLIRWILLLLTLIPSQQNTTNTKHLILLSCHPFSHAFLTASNRCIYFHLIDPFHSVNSLTFSSPILPTLPISIFLISFPNMPIISNVDPIYLTLFISHPPHLPSPDIMFLSAQYTFPFLNTTTANAHFLFRTFKEYSIVYLTFLPSAIRRNPFFHPPPPRLLSRPKISI